MLKFGLGELMLMMKITESIRPICETSLKLIENSQQYIEEKKSLFRILKLIFNSLK